MQKIRDGFMLFTLEFYSLFNNKFSSQNSYSQKIKSAAVNKFRKIKDKWLLP